MIVLLSYSISWSQNDYTKNSSTGERVASPDSVLIAYDDLRKVNAKMVELKYEKEINDSLRSIIKNDDTIIRTYDGVANTLKKQIVSYKKQRNIAIGSGLALALSLFISIIVK